MNGDLASAVADYLAHMRALGRKFRDRGDDLDLFVAFADSAA